MSNQPVVLFIEPEWVLNPTDPNIAAHLSLPHDGSVGIRNSLRPTRSDTLTLLYGLLLP